MKCSLGISDFLEEISSLSHSIVFLYFFARSLRRAFLSLLTILWNSTFKWVYLSFSPLLFTSLLFTAICEAPQTAILLFYISFSWGWSWSLSPVQCHEPPSIVYQALCLSNLSEMAMATHSSSLAWKIPWTDEPGRLHAVHGLTKSRIRLSDFTFTFHIHALEKEMATHVSVHAWRISGMAESGGLPSMGSHRVGHDWSNLASASIRSSPLNLFLTSTV